MTQSTLRSPFPRVALLSLALAMAGPAAAQQPPVTYRLDWGARLGVSARRWTSGWPIWQ
jgi:hypothetical protein